MAIYRTSRYIIIFLLGSQDFLARKLNEIKTVLIFFAKRERGRFELSGEDNECVKAKRENENRHETSSIRSYCTK